MTSESPVSESEKREALETVLASHTFARSAQLRAFLRHICEMELAGRTEQLNEYEIAVEVLGRKKDVDLTGDSSVRNRAYEVRQRLERYYAAEAPGAAVRIEIPKGGYVPQFVRHAAEMVPATVPPEVVIGPGATRARLIPLWAAAAIALVCLVGGWLVGAGSGKARPAAVLEEAWGPLADPQGDLLIAIATNLHLLIRPHVPPRTGRMDVPRELYPLFSATRPLEPNEPLYMESAQLSVPMGEVAAAATIASTRAAFGGGVQILPESEAPLTAALGRNAVIFGTPVNSRSATVLLRTVPLTIGFTAGDQFAVIDQRKGTVLYTPSGWEPETQYGLLTVLTGTDHNGKPRRTLQVTGTGSSAALQGAVEFFCSANAMRDLKRRMGGAFPPNYQVVVRCTANGVRLMGYQYETHVVAENVPRRR